MLEALREEFMTVQNKPDYDDKKIVMRLTHFIKISPKNLKEIKLLDECIADALKIVGRNFVEKEIMKLTDVKAIWLNQFNTKDLTAMMYEIKNKKVA
jgi:hypothetical protein